MTERPTAAPAHWPYHEHRTLAEVDRVIRCQTCGDDVSPRERDFECAYDKCPINREPLW